MNTSCYETGWLKSPGGQLCKLGSPCSSSQEVHQQPPRLLRLEMILYLEKKESCFNWGRRHMGTSDPHMLQYLQKRRQHLYWSIFSGKELTRPTGPRPTLQMQTPRCQEACWEDTPALQRTAVCSHINSEGDKGAVNSTSIFWGCGPLLGKPIANYFCLFVLTATNFHMWIWEYSQEEEKMSMHLRHSKECSTSADLSIILHSTTHQGNLCTQHIPKPQHFGACSCPQLAASTTQGLNSLTPPTSELSSRSVSNTHT